MLTRRSHDGLPPAIHEVRKRIKRLRALLRLTADELDEEFRREQNRVWRRITHALSPWRDADAYLATWQSLQRLYPDRINGHTISASRKPFSEKHGSKGLTTEARRKLRKKLVLALSRIKGLTLNHIQKKDLRAGLRRTRHDYHESYRKARRSPTDENLHTWRKRAKDWAHQLEMAPAEISRPQRRKIKPLGKLGKMLGEDHDLAMFKQQLSHSGPDTFSDIQQLLKKRRHTLQKEAFKKGQKLV